MVRVWPISELYLGWIGREELVLMLKISKNIEKWNSENRGIFRIFSPHGAPKKSILQAKSGQTELKNEVNMVSIALDEFSLVSGG